ncbi:hypothetical protein M0R45_014796 [Rubus argutus]|uniref:Uncharacterized protein n=1 Tax=Rubus argutus TaxID=59490 RepID=A0AAW1XP06_RUBAR
MAKSSSSHRKKRDKISSKARTKKRSKIKSKGEKYRSKKLLKSDSSFSSEDDRRSRSRRARSRTRRDAKGTKKRARKRSFSRDSSEDSPRPRVKKRKASKKDNDYESKKRNRSREKPRRIARTSSVSSESWSCSTCPGGDISGDEIESKRHRGRPEKRKREETDRNKVESRTGRSMYRSRSRSLRSQFSESDCQSEEKVTGESNARRLKSVIAVTEEDNQGRWLDEDGHKEEITYDHDDYPSCRSNDSNDGGSKRELDTHLHVASEERTRLEGANEEEGLVSNTRIMDLPKSGNIFHKDGGRQEEVFNSSHDGTRVTDDVNESKVSGEISSLINDDLETILRQKALENLKRFRGKDQRFAVSNPEDKKQPYTVKAELVQIESPKVDGAKEYVAEIIGGTQLVEETNAPLRGSICSSINPEKEPDKKNDGNEVASAKGDVACSTPPQEAVAGKSNKKVTTTADVDKPNLATPESLKRPLASQEPPRERLLVTERRVDNVACGTAQTVNQSSNSNGQDISNGSGSAAPEPSGENRSDKQQDEAKDGSQFEQKTMSVMRGSEMVQVSYKVYIPKKAPALARRQLRR